MNMQSYQFKKKFIIKCVKEAFTGGSNDIQSIFTENGSYSDYSLSSLEQNLTEDFIEKFDNSKSSSKTRETTINSLTKLLNNLKNDMGELLMIKGDPIIQIGTVFHKYGD